MDVAVILGEHSKHPAFSHPRGACRWDSGAVWRLQWQQLQRRLHAASVRHHGHVDVAVILGGHSKRPACSHPRGACRWDCGAIWRLRWQHLERRLQAASVRHHGHVDVAVILGRHSKRPAYSHPHGACRWDCCALWRHRWQRCVDRHFQAASVRHHGHVDVAVIFGGHSRRPAWAHPRGACRWDCRLLWRL